MEVMSDCFGEMKFEEARYAYHLWPSAGGLGIWLVRALACPSTLQILSDLTTPQVGLDEANLLSTTTQDICFLLSSAGTFSHLLAQPPFLLRVSDSENRNQPPFLSFFTAAIFWH